MKSKEFYFTNIENIPVYVTYKKVKNINMTLSIDKLKLSIPYNVTNQHLEWIVNEIKPQIISKHKKLIKKNSLDSRLNKLKKIKNINSLNKDLEKDLSKIIKNFQIYKRPVEDLNIIESFLLFGEDIQVNYTSCSEPHFNNNILYIPKNLKNDKEQVIKIIDKHIREKVEPFLTETSLLWCKKLGLSINYIGLRKMKTRWGSCTPATGRIRINFYLSALPKRFMESIILHELTHITILGHSKDFYDLYYKTYPMAVILDKVFKVMTSPINYLR